MGTPHYLSPEQVNGEPVSSRSDLYSLGAVLYQMLTGRVPYDAQTPVGVAAQHLSGQLRAPSEIEPSIPLELKDLTVRLMARRSEYRPQDAAELLQ